MHGCESLHVESVAVKEVFEGQTAWETKVEVFDLIGHRQAKRAYAWLSDFGFPCDNGPQAVAL